MTSCMHSLCPLMLSMSDNLVSDTVITTCHDKDCSAIDHDALLRASFFAKHHKDLWTVTETRNTFFDATGCTAALPFLAQMLQNDGFVEITAKQAKRSMHYLDERVCLCCGARGADELADHTSRASVEPCPDSHHQTLILCLFRIPNLIARQTT